MRYLFGFMCVLALGVMGCSETTGAGGDGGTGGVGGDGGSGGVGGGGGTGGMPECESAENCDDGEDCTTDNCASGVCDNTAVEDGTACDESNECTVGQCAGGACESTPITSGTACGDDAGTCQDGSCQVACSEQGIRDAIAAGGGPYTFSCDGQQTVVTAEEIIIDNDVILDGEGSLTVDGDDDHRVFSVPFGITVTLEGLSVTRGYASEQPVGDGGGIHHEGALLTLIDCTVSNNNAFSRGGGIFSVGPSAETTLVNTAVTGNSPSGIHASGVYSDFSVPALTLVRSTVSGNSGGGIIGGDPLTLVNSTVSGNTSTQPHEAAIVAIGSTTITNSTVSRNPGGPDLTLGPSANVAVVGTIVDGDCSFEGNASIPSNGYNIESPGDTCGFDPDGTDRVNVTVEQLNLGELADNGGPTMTHALEAGSEAINKIPASDCDVDEDQRGEPRPETGGAMCDVGAFEVQP